MARASEGSTARLASAMALSLVLHALALPALEALILTPIELTERALPPAAAGMVDESASKELVTALEPPPPAALRPEVPPPKPPKPPKPEGQVVEIPPPEREETPDDAKYLSEYDSKVEREQVSARNAPPSPAMRKSERRLIAAGDDMNGSMDGDRNRKSERTPERFSPVEADGDAQREAEQARAEREAQQAARERVVEQGAKLTEGEGPFRAVDEAGSQRAAAPQSGGKMGGAPAPESYKALLPTLGPEELAVMDGSIDKVDAPKGDQTLLNTREYKYASFFNRVKRGVQQQWRAVEVHRRYDPYGRVFGVRDRLTVVEVTLNADGSLDDIYVKQDSGVVFLDEAALTAFRKAAPFPNPPEALLEEDGRVRFSFGFYLEINGRGFRINRLP